MAERTAGMVAEGQAGLGPGVVTWQPPMIPRRTLFFLVMLVLVLHVGLLAGASANSVRPASAQPLQVFETRTVVLAAPEPPAAAPPPTVQPKPTAAVRTAPAARKPRPQPTPATVASPPSTDQRSSAPAAWSLPSASELQALAGTDDPPAEPQEDGTAPPHLSSDGAAPTNAPPPATVLASAVSIKPSAASPEAAAPAPTPAASLPPVKLLPPARLDFEVTGKAKGFGYNAGAELVWQHDGSSYSAHQEIKVFLLGSRSQDSVGSITEHGLQPRRFGDRARSERAAHFDFAAGRVTFSANTPAAPIEPGAQDRLSVFLQLGGMLAAAPERYPAGTQIAMTTIGARAADVWTFTVEGEQSLDLPIGQLTAVQLQRLPRREYDQKAQVWLAPSLGYLPVRIRLTEANGDFAELNLQSREAP